NVDVLHTRRPELPRDVPVHVTWRTRPDARLRGSEGHAALREAIAAGQKGTFRVRDHSVLGDHVHLIVEAADRIHLARGMQGLATRLARGLNRRLGRRGRVFQHRYHARPLLTAEDVRAALAFLDRDGRRHGAPGPGGYRKLDG